MKVSDSFSWSSVDTYHNFSFNWNSKSFELFKTLCETAWLNVFNLSNDDFIKFKDLFQFDYNSVQRVVDNFDRISKLCEPNFVSLDVVKFFIILSKNKILYDFLDLCDIIDLKEILSISSYFSFDFSKIDIINLRNIVLKLRSNFPYIKISLGSFFRLSKCYDVFFIDDGPFFLWVENSDIQIFESDILLHSLPVDLWSDIWKNKFYVINSNNNDYLYVDRLYDTTYSFSSFMYKTQSPYRLKILKFAMDYLPTWSKIVFTSTLSWDSFPFLLNLCKNQEKYNLEVSFNSTYVKLNCFWTYSNLSNHIKEKNIWHFDYQFECKNFVDARNIVREINSLIVKKTDVKCHMAHIKLFKNLHWWIILPSFEVVKLWDVWENIL